MLKEGQNIKSANIGWSIFFIIFGLYLVAGAITAIIQSQWPVFMPAQFDLINLMTGLLGSTVGIYIASLTSGLVGAGLVWLGVIIIKHD